VSIYASLASPDDSEHTDDCAQWEKHGDLWEISDRPCDCGQPDAPLVYQGSHILPDEKHDKRGGFVDLALIPSHITRDGRDDRAEGRRPVALSPVRRQQRDGRAHAPPRRADRRRVVLLARKDGRIVMEEMFAVDPLSMRGRL